MISLDRAGGVPALAVSLAWNVAQFRTHDAGGTILGPATSVH
jgi:hypothetical protein